MAAGLGKSNYHMKSPTTNTHKWWHFLFVSWSSKSERSTSYCGKYLWHHFSYDQYECSKCQKFHINLKDYKSGQHTVLKWVDFKDIVAVVELAKKS